MEDLGRFAAEQPESARGAAGVAGATDFNPGSFAPYPVPWFAGVAWGWLLCAAYPLLIVTPLAVFAMTSPTSTRSPAVEVGMDCALVAFTILALQFVISARLRWLEAPFGLDVVLQFHRMMALVAVGLLCFHALLMAWGESWGLLTRWRVPWPLWAGRLALFVLFLHVAAAIFRRVLALRYETWRRLHNAAAFLLLGLAFVHGVALGDDFERPAARIFWTALPLLAWSAWFYGRMARPQFLRRHAFRVVSTAPEAPRVWTLLLEAAEDRVLKYAPGQFAFFCPQGSIVLAEEHPFSIASSPSSGGRISVTVKECGDFTSTIGRLQRGDLVTVHGPFGRFSHVFYSGGDELVFVAAGIGITPLMSMLRAMRARAEPRRVLLIYANHGVADIVFRKELESIESQGLPALRTIHVLSRPSATWDGPTGRLDSALLLSLCGGFADKVFFICCPPVMASGLIRGLRKAGVAPHCIHADYFGL